MTTSQETATAKNCYCGCGLPTANPTARFLQGHDARMVSTAIRSLFEDFEYLGVPVTNGASVEQRARTLLVTIYNRFGPALAHKFNNACLARFKKEAKTAARLEAKQAKQAAKTAKTAKPEPVADGETIKIGRWEYPTARVAGSGVIYRNTKRDGSGTWEEVA